jgi:hypothetical protein
MAWAPVRNDAPTVSVDCADDDADAVSLNVDAFGQKLANVRVRGTSHAAIYASHYD